MRPQHSSIASLIVHALVLCQGMLQLVVLQRPEDRLVKRLVGIPPVSTISSEFGQGHLCEAPVFAFLNVRLAAVDWKGWSMVALSHDVRQQRVADSSIKIQYFETVDVFTDFTWWVVIILWHR